MFPFAAMQWGQMRWVYVNFPLKIFDKFEESETTVQSYSEIYSVHEVLHRMNIMDNAALNMKALHSSEFYYTLCCV